MATDRGYRRYVSSALGGRRFNLLIFFVTLRCNAKCDFCFYWDHLNHQGDLTLEEIRHVSATMPRFIACCSLGVRPSCARNWRILSRSSTDTMVWR